MAENLRLTRLPDWASRLNKAISARRDDPFKYGEHDCCIGFTYLINAMTQEDIAKNFPSYNDEEGANAILDLHGGIIGIAERVAELYGLKEIDINRAQRGDLIVVQAVLGESLAICTGRTAFAATYRGWAAIGRGENWLRAWRI